MKIVIEKLQENIDSTPTSIAEQKEMLNELRYHKKELTLQKREINESIRQVNAQTRQEISKLTGISKGFVGDIARYSRMSVRYQKETANKSNEEAKSVINRQLQDIDKKILWVSRFKGNGNVLNQSILYCSYCGRRVKEGEPCRSCGSIQTTLMPR